ncbi:MAG: zinc ribbon domain-containing protein [Candidatus Jordarchaeaceae archaeon]
MRKSYIFNTNVEIPFLKNALETYFTNLGLTVSEGTVENEFTLASGPHYDLPVQIAVSIELRKAGQIMVKLDYPGDIIDTQIETLKIVNNADKIVKKILQTGKVPTESLIPGHTMPQPPPKLCPKCKQPIKEDWKLCPNCGTPLETKKPRCPNCGKQMEPSWKICPYCGEKLVEKTDSKQEETAKLCPKCGAEMPINAIYCAKCGNPME